MSLWPIIVIGHMTSKESMVIVMSAPRQPSMPSSISKKRHLYHATSELALEAIYVLNNNKKNEADISVSLG